ncbi:MAG: hypothetical protein K0R34_2354 [Herbinix sp.]|jgi:hypothetical protein|nr:hypothetical protein [Herbinix sp.]
MSKRKKKNAVTLILLLFALAGLIGFYYWYTNREPVSEEATEDNAITLSTIDTEKVNNLHYIYDDTELTLIKEAEGWVSEDDKERPINQDRVKSILDIIDNISATRIVAETLDNLGDFGLSDSTSYLQATLADGSRITLVIGNKAAMGEGYYAMVNEDGKVYLLDTSYGSGLKFTDEDMTAVAKDLTIEAANIRHISVDNRDSEDFELLYEENNIPGNSGSAMFPWVILKPYTHGYTADSSAVTALQEKYTTFDYIKCVEYKALDRKKYGLDNPMASIELEYLESRTVKLDQPEKNPETGEEITEKTYYDPKEYKLSVGNLDESNNYYVMIDGDNSVYTLDKDAIDNMARVDVFSLLNKFVAIPNIDMVEQVDIDIDGTAYTMSMKRTSGKNDKGEAEVRTTYIYNGKEVEEKAFREIYQIMISAKYDAPIKEEVVAKGTKSYLSMTFRLNDEEKTVLTASYLPYDESFYIINNGETRFFADKRKIDEIVKAIIEFKATEK